MQYIQFTDNENNTFLVETDGAELHSEEGIVKAGLQDLPGKAVFAAQTLFEQAVKNVIQHNAKAFLQAVRDLPTQDRPESMEITFALKATGELGNVAVAKGTGEANYTITLIWKR